MKTIAFIFLFLVAGMLSAQGEFNQWHFGEGAILDFNGGAPVASGGSAIVTDEGSASIADAQGNLLFYTDGVTVWNSNNQPMPNGSGLGGHSSSSQSALIMPVPGTSDQYYLFTMNEIGDNGDLLYSMVDMSLDSGLGDIVPGVKNVPLGSNFTEKLVGASSGCGLWVLVHQRDSDAFYAFPVVPAGIGAPVISNVGTPHISNTAQSPWTGVMKVSQDNQRIALATLTNIVEVLDFDNVSGIVSNVISIPIPPTQFSYGVCFSPGSQFLYAGEADPMLPMANTLYQYDLSSGTPAGIVASKTSVGVPSSPASVVFDAQIGPDGRIYVARYGTNFLDVIASPDNPGAGCGYISGGVVFPGTLNRCRMGLPNQPRFPENTLIDLADLGNDTLLCPGATLVLHSSAAGPQLWSDGSAGDSLTVSAAGTYWLEVGTGSCVNRDSIVITVASTVQAGNDVVVCAGNSVTLAATGAGSYSWTGGITDGVPFVPTASQSYTVTGTTAEGCTSTDIVTVTVEAAPAVQFSANALSGCLPLMTTFQGSGGPGSTFSWDFGDGSTGSGAFASHVYNSPGCHDVSLLATSPAGCTASVTLPGYICSFTAPTASFTFDPLLLEGSVAEVTFTNTSENATSWVWDFGDQGVSTDQSPVHTYQPSADGYWIILLATNANGCQDTARAFLPYNNGPVYYVPNIFTPDGNEFNQVFLPVFTSGFDPRRYSLMIFNRWGELLFESADHRTGWDGSSTTGTLVPDGVYVWKIYFSPPDTDERTALAGHVVLVR